MSQCQIRGAGGRQRWQRSFPGKEIPRPLSARILVIRGSEALGPTTWSQFLAPRSGGVITLYLLGQMLLGSKPCHFMPLNFGCLDHFRGPTETHLSPLSSAFPASIRGLSFSRGSPPSGVPSSARGLLPCCALLSLPPHNCSLPPGVVLQCNNGPFIPCEHSIITTLT